MKKIKEVKRFEGKHEKFQHTDRVPEQENSENEEDIVLKEIMTENFLGMITCKIYKYGNNNIYQIV